MKLTCGSVNEVYMVTATYIFNEEKVIAAGKTVEEMMAPIRQMLLENGAEEIAPGVFCKDGFYAMDVIDLPLIYIRKHLKYLDALDIWTMDIDGEVEDCKEGMINYYKKRGYALE